MSEINNWSGHRYDKIPKPFIAYDVFYSPWSQFQYMTRRRIIRSHTDSKLQNLGFELSCRLKSTVNSCRRHQMETLSMLLAICAGKSPATGKFPAQRPVTRSFDVFFDLRLNKGLSKQFCGWWFETLSSPLWRHSNVRQVSQQYCCRVPGDFQSDAIIWTTNGVILR